MKVLMIVVVVLALVYCLERARREPHASVMWTAGAVAITIIGVGIVFA